MILSQIRLRLDEIGAELENVARENVLAPLVAAENAAAVRETLDLSRSVPSSRF